MKIISNWQDKNLICACCGSTKSVKYEYNSKNYCNRCVLKDIVDKLNKQGGK